MVQNSMGFVSMPPSWGVVLDCGSSGTRLHVYTWAYPGAAVLEAASFKAEPGISDFVNNVSSLGEYIQPLLDHAVQRVPESARATTRLLAQATAGMRLLTPAQQEPIWASLRSRLSGSPFSFVDADAWTISGNYEGLYGFLAASYLAKVPFGSAFGYLDLGGASTQIAFVPDGKSPTLLEDAYRVRHGSQLARVYSHSYMRSGQHEALERLLSQLPGAGREGVIDCPCYNPGYNVTRRLCSPSGVCRNGTLIRGSGDWKDCHARSTALLHQEYECLMPPCAAMGVYQPREAGGRLPRVADPHLQSPSSCPMNLAFALAGTRCGWRALRRVVGLLLHRCRHRHRRRTCHQEPHVCRLRACGRSLLRAPMGRRGYRRPVRVGLLLWLGVCA